MSTCLQVAGYSLSITNGYHCQDTTHAALLMNWDGEQEADCTELYKLKVLRVCVCVWLISLINLLKGAFDDVISVIRRHWFSSRSGDSHYRGLTWDRLTVMESAVPRGSWKFGIIAVFNSPHVPEICPWVLWNLKLNWRAGVKFEQVETLQVRLSRDLSATCFSLQDMKLRSYAAKKLGNLVVD